MNISITQRMQQMARQYMQEALLGTWAKIGRSKYQRCTGEVVEKVGNVWSGDGLYWQSAYAAMSRIDYINKGKHHG